MNIQLSLTMEETRKLLIILNNSYVISKCDYARRLYEDIKTQSGV